VHSDPPVRAGKSSSFRRYRSYSFFFYFFADVAEAEQFEQPAPNLDFFNFEFDNASRNLSFEFFLAEDWMDFDQGVLF
jgi:hypothetical protein